MARTKIIIIENSDILQSGLESIFLKSKESLLVQKYNENNWEHAFTQCEAFIVIATPRFFDFNKKLFNLLKQKQNILLIGLIYTYHHPESITEYNDLIYLNDDALKIESTINTIIDKSVNHKFTIPSDSLSDRETEVLKWLASGLSNKQISEKLHISVHTVNNHRKNIVRKLDIKTISGLTIYAVIHNIISI